MYLPAASQAIAEALRSKPWQLTRPPSVSGNDVTQYYTNYVKHPQAEAYYVHFPDGDEIYIHPDADERIMDDVLQPFVAMGLITQQTLDDMAAAIAAHKTGGEPDVDPATGEETPRGRKMVFTDHIPAVWLAMAKTREELEAMGFFPAPPNL